MDTARKDSQLIVEKESASDVLSSWKEIAQYLGRGVRTVQRWERQNNLPICRPSRSAGLILARKRDLDQWIAAGRAEAAEQSDVNADIADLASQLEAAQREIARLRAQLQAASSKTELDTVTQKSGTSERLPTSQERVIPRPLVA